MQTPLYDMHKQLGANLVDFAGWEMPLLYSSIIGEHNFTRTHATMFDVSHMGRLYLIGNDADARVGIEWGLAGVPETFVISAEGKVMLRIQGPLNEPIMKRQVLPMLEELIP